MHSEGIFYMQLLESCQKLTCFLKPEPLDKGMVRADFRTNRACYALFVLLYIVLGRFYAKRLQLDWVKT